MSDQGKKLDDAPDKGWLQTPTDVIPAVPDKDMEIEVVDDTPDKDRGRPKRDPNKPLPPDPDTAAPELEKYLKQPRSALKDRVKDLTFEVHNQRREKETAQRERDEAIRVAREWQAQSSQHQTTIQQRQQEYLEQARTSSESEVTLAQKALAAAIEGGKGDDIAIAQTALSRAVAKQEQLPKVPRQQPQPVQQQPAVDQWQQQQRPQTFAQQPQAQTPDPKAVKWFRDNPWFGNDEVMTGAAYGLHEKLIKTGVHPQSDDYYQKIDQGMRTFFPGQFQQDDDDEDEPQAGQRPNIVSAPARGTAPRKVQLTATQAALAKRLGITLEQYAAQLIKESKANG